jgi:divinyl protochlorophyllide a 8-vinyl-reductase
MTLALAQHPADALDPDRIGSRIGPNAIIQAAAALDAGYGRVITRRVFERAGLLERLENPPGHMVPEAEVTRLHLALRAVLGPEGSRAVAREAGLLTGDYVCANRIPAPVRWLLQNLPPRAASPLLLAAIRRHAWTFVGSGRLTIVPGPPVRVEIAGCQICRATLQDSAIGSFYAAAFERLFQQLVSPAAVAVEEGRSRPDGVVRFNLRWGRSA